MSYVSRLPLNSINTKVIASKHLCEFGVNESGWSRAVMCIYWIKAINKDGGNRVWVRQGGLSNWIKTLLARKVPIHHHHPLCIILIVNISCLAGRRLLVTPTLSTSPGIRRCKSQYKHLYPSLSIEDETLSIALSLIKVCSLFNGGWRSAFN